VSVALNSNQVRWQQLRDLDSAIAERKEYLKHQEQLIKDCIQEGNAILLSLRTDIQFAEQELRRLKNDIHNVIDDKMQLMEQIGSLRQEVTVLAVSVTPEYPTLRPLLG
jgi:chromosome segregation ATPase